MAELTTEQTAALEEGLAEMPAELIEKREEFLVLKEQRDEINDQMSKIKDAFGDALKDQGLQGFLLHGKVHARRSEVITNRVDSGELKAKMPHIWKRFLKVSKSVRITVN